MHFLNNIFEGVDELIRINSFFSFQVKNLLNVRFQDVTEGLLTLVIERSTCMFTPQINPTIAPVEVVTNPTLILRH